MSIFHPTPTQATEAPAATPPARQWPRGPGEPRQENAYAIACAWTDGDPRIRLRRSPQAAAAYKAISLLPRPWGEKLDTLGASHRELRWLAGTTGHAHAAARDARFRGLVQMLEAPPAGISRGQAFEALKASLPKMREARPRPARRASSTSRPRRAA